MIFKKVTIEEIDNVMKIINDAKDLLRKDSLQWQQGYPNEDTMKNDINNEILYGIYDDGKLVGIEALVPGVNNDYLRIYNGTWLSPVSPSDLVIHRIAVKCSYHGKHIGQQLMEFAYQYALENGYKSIKIDTHEKNKAMQHLCDFNGYTYCGIIYLLRDEIDNSRLAFERIVQ